MVRIERSIYWKGDESLRMKRQLVIHPVLFAVFPILFLFSFNKHLLRIDVIVKPMAIIVGCTLIFWLILNIALKSRVKSALFVSLFLLLFFSYGHFLNVMQDVYTLFYGDIIDCTISVLLIWSILFFVGIFYIVRSRRDFSHLTHFLNVVAVSLVIISLIDIGAYEVKKTQGVRQTDRDKTNKKFDTQDLDIRSSSPNIYYILLDGYARADVLEEIYLYDNTEFLDSLRRKGFFVANKSVTNYAQTFLSLASTLNLQYLDEVTKQIGVDSDDRMPLIDMIEDNEVIRFLKEFGYTIVLFDDWIAELEGLEIRNVDFHITLERTHFEDFLIRTTPISLFLKMLRQDPYTRHRARLLYNFDHLVDACYFDPPIFAFTHILMPHPPFVFREDGEAVIPDRKFVYFDPFIKDGENVDVYLNSYKKDYTKQLIFLNNKLKSVIDDILTYSPRPSIIILQADHGPASTLVDDWYIKDDEDFKERMAILNAYYFPNGGYAHVYDDITPVNTFRVIFNHYFGANYELLRDECYFSTWSQPYKLIRVTEKVNTTIATQ